MYSGTEPEFYEGTNAPETNLSWMIINIKWIKINQYHFKSNI